jgi:hypothetical protein
MQSTYFFICLMCGTGEAPGMRSPMPHFSYLAVRFDHTQNWIYTVSQPWFKCIVWQHSKDLAAVYAVGNMQFSPMTFLPRDPNVWNRCDSCLGRNMWFYCFKMFMAQNMSSVTSRKNLLMQKCFVKKWKRMTFLSKHFNSPLVICDTIFFADNSRVHSINLS